MESIVKQFEEYALLLEQGQGNTPMLEYLRSWHARKVKLKALVVLPDASDMVPDPVDGLEWVVLYNEQIAAKSPQDLDAVLLGVRFALICSAPMGWDARKSELLTGLVEVCLAIPKGVPADWSNPADWKGYTTLGPNQEYVENVDWQTLGKRWLDFGLMDHLKGAVQIFQDTLNQRKNRLESRQKSITSISPRDLSQGIQVGLTEKLKFFEEKMGQLRKEWKPFLQKSVSRKLDYQHPDNRDLHKKWFVLDLEKFTSVIESRQVRYSLDVHHSTILCNGFLMELKDRLSSIIVELNTFMQKYAKAELEPAYQSVALGKESFPSLEFPREKILNEVMGILHVSLVFNGEVPRKTQWQILVEGGRGGPFMFFSSVFGILSGTFAALTRFGGDSKAPGGFMSVLEANFPYIAAGMAVTLLVLFVRGMFLWIDDWNDEVKRKQSDMLDKALREAERMVIDATRRATSSMEKLLESSWEEQERGLQQKLQEVRKQVDLLIKEEQNRLSQENTQKQALLGAEKTVISKLETGLQNLQKSFDSAITGYLRRAG